MIGEWNCKGKGVEKYGFLRRLLLWNCENEAIYWSSLSFLLLWFGGWSGVFFLFYFSFYFINLFNF